MSNAQDIPVWEKYTLTIEDEVFFSQLLAHVQLIKLTKHETLSFLSIRFSIKQQNPVVAN